MKKTLLSLIALFSICANAATTNPVQLLSPTGSTSGQAVVSTGSSSAPNWGTVGVAGGGTGVTSFGAFSTVVANGTAGFNWVNPGASGTIYASTGGSSFPTFQTLSALGIAPLNSPAFTGTPSFAGSPTFQADLVRGGAAGTSRGMQYLTGSNLRWYQFVDNTTESGGNAGSNWNLSRYNDAGSFLDTPFSVLRSSGAVTIKGSQTNDSAAAGFVGEYVTNTTTSTSLTSGTIANCTSVSLTAGDWDVSGVTRFNAGSATAITNFQTGINTTSATFAGLGTQQTLQTAWTSSVSIDELATPVVRQSLSTTTTVYLPAVSTFSGTMTCNGFIRARRVR